MLPSKTLIDFFKRKMPNYRKPTRRVGVQAMFRKRIPLLFVAASSLLASCSGGNAQNSANSRVDAKVDFDTVFNITRYSNKANVGTMEFLPLTEKQVSSTVFSSCINPPDFIRIFVHTLFFVVSYPYFDCQPSHRSHDILMNRGHYTRSIAGRVCFCRCPSNAGHAKHILLGLIWPECETSVHN